MVPLTGCELFTAVLTQRAWAFTQRDNRCDAGLRPKAASGSPAFPTRSRAHLHFRPCRQVIQRRDLINALKSDAMYDFLLHMHTSGQGSAAAATSTT